MDIKVPENDDVSCIYLAAGRVHWQVTVNVVTNAGLSYYWLLKQNSSPWFISLVNISLNAFWFNCCLSRR